MLCLLLVLLCCALVPSWSKLAAPTVLISDGRSIHRVLASPVVTVAPHIIRVTPARTHSFIGGFGQWGIAEQWKHPGHVPFGWPLGSNYGFTPWGRRSRGWGLTFEGFTAGDDFPIYI